MPETNTQEKAYNYAVKLLTLRLRTVGELFEKLQQKKFSRPIVLSTIRRLEELDFLNDERYAEIFVENLKRYKDFGYYGIKTKLHHKHIPTEIIEKVLEELELAQRFLKKLKRQGRKKYEQLARSLSSKGYHTDIIQQVLRQEFTKGNLSSVTR